MHVQGTRKRNHNSNVTLLSRHYLNNPHPKKMLILVWKTDLQARETQLGPKNEVHRRGILYPKIFGSGLLSI